MQWIFRLVVFAALPGAMMSADLTVTGSPGAGDLILAAGNNLGGILVEPAAARAVQRAARDLADDFQRVSGTRPEVQDHITAPEKIRIIVGTLGQGGMIDRLAADGKLATSGIAGAWESYVLQVVTNPLPGLPRALVIAGSDRRGTVFGIYQLSEMIGVSPWYWWADVPVAKNQTLVVHGDFFRQPAPAVKYRGIFLNDEEFGLRPWAAKTFEPEVKNIGPKTYARIFELLLRLRANYLWPAMHPGTAAFNSFATNKEIADAYGIVMGSSHCEQMLRNNVSEWDEKALGDYNFVTNPGGVLNYWEQRVRANGRFENIYTLGMRGIHDGGMPGGGSPAEKAARLHTIIAGQREMLARLVNPDLAAVPQIFCPYKEVLELYRFAPDIPADITLVWPDDNYGYVRQFSDARERARPGGAGVYYHVSYWGAPRDYLWLCSTPPALIAEEMTKAYEYGANRVWLLNVGDLKPAELDIEFFLKLAWNPPAWNGTNTYDLLARQLARDFGEKSAPELTAMLAEYYRLNFQRKPEHMAFPTNTLFSGAGAAQRLAAWRNLSARAAVAETNLPPEFRDAFFELVGYPVRAAAAMNEKCLAGSAPAAAEIHRLTAIYNQQIAGGKWRNMMSANPRGLVDFGVPANSPAGMAAGQTDGFHPVAANLVNGADFVEDQRRIIMEADHASQFVTGLDAAWKPISGLGYNGAAVAVFPVTTAVRSTPEKILAESPCLQFNLWLQSPGGWQVIVRALPTFSVETGQPQRYAIAFDEASPQIISLPASTSEADKTWQENVLRNAVLTTSLHSIAAAGPHTLKIWMVDPGIVLDTVAALAGDQPSLGYVWPAETRVSR